MSTAQPAKQEWPALRVDDWTTTRDTLHMWLQIVGKVELTSTTLINHWWNVSYIVSTRGLRTRMMHAGNVDFDAEFDFVDHRLVLRTTSGEEQSVALTPKTVATFYSEVQSALAALGIGCTIDASPNEVDPAIPFADDTTHASYDADAVHTFWQQLVRMNEVFAKWRAGYGGKASPVQLFWGSMDLSATRFSGRTAPPHTGAPANCPAWVMTEAESMENAAAGYWPGGSEEGTFYAYLYPQPKGYESGDLSPAHFDSDLGEWVLPYRTVRESADPAATLLSFLESTYAHGADRAGWDRSALEVNPDRLEHHSGPGRTP